LVFFHLWNVSHRGYYLPSSQCFGFACIISCTTCHYDIDIIIKYMRYQKVMIIALAMNYKLQWFIYHIMHANPTHWLLGTWYPRWLTFMHVCRPSKKRVRPSDNCLCVTSSSKIITLIHFGMIITGRVKQLDFDAMLNTGLPLSIYTTKPPIDMWRCSLNNYVKGRYQLNYFFVSNTSMHKQWRSNFN
jgi:hypothetical protein